MQLLPIMELPLSNQLKTENQAEINTWGEKKASQLLWDANN
jgi:hypothetical protein